MSLERDFANNCPFQVFRPDCRSRPYLFNSPHSGRIYPPAFMRMSCLDSFDIRLSEDRFVDQIFADLVDDGAVFMMADFPRAYLDVNREAFELDATMFVEPMPGFVSPPGPRVAAGFGSVARFVAAGKPIYDHKLPLQEALSRIHAIHQPYHQCLRAELQTLRAAHGFCVLIDCHSMPGRVRGRPAQGQPDVILGDMHGRACAPALTDYAEQLLRDFGYHVIRNQPYAGGYITSHYGCPSANMHALQIEINRDLYVDPHTLEKNSGFTPLCANMLAFGRQLMRLEDAAFAICRNAAE